MSLCKSYKVERKQGRMCVANTTQKEANHFFFACVFKALCVHSRSGSWRPAHFIRRKAKNLEKSVGPREAQTVQERAF